MMTGLSLYVLERLEKRTAKINNCPECQRNWTACNHNQPNYSAMIQGLNDTSTDIYSRKDW